MSQERARKIKLLLFDVDGVMTDGKLFFVPGAGGGDAGLAVERGRLADGGGFAVAGDAVEVKGFHAHDGTAITLARLGGLRTGLITKRLSETVALRARDLRLDHVYQGVAEKLSALEEILRQEGLAETQAAYVGDDLIDLPVMRRCGLAIAVANARAEIKKEAHYVTENRGGEGAVRDAVEYILRAQGSWDEAVEKYLAARTPEKEEA